MTDKAYEDYVENNLAVFSNELEGFYWNFVMNCGLGEDMLRDVLRDFLMELDNG